MLISTALTKSFTVDVVGFVVAVGGEEAEAVHTEKVFVEFQTVFQLGFGGFQQSKGVVPCKLVVL